MSFDVNVLYNVYIGDIVQNKASRKEVPVLKIRFSIRLLYKVESSNCTKTRTATAKRGKRISKPYDLCIQKEREQEKVNWVNAPM